jgi:hypothetical protein
MKSHMLDASFLTYQKHLIIGYMHHAGRRYGFSKRIPARSGATYVGDSRNVLARG